MRDPLRSLAMVPARESVGARIAIVINNSFDKSSDAQEVALRCGDNDYERPSDETLQAVRDALVREKCKLQTIIQPKPEFGSPTEIDATLHCGLLRAAADPDATTSPSLAKGKLKRNAAPSGSTGALTNGPRPSSMQPSIAAAAGQEFFFSLQFFLFLSIEKIIIMTSNRLESTRRYGTIQYLDLEVCMTMYAGTSRTAVVRSFSRLLELKFQQ